MAEPPDPLGRLIEEFRRLPGVGAKTAERLAYHVLRSPEAEALALAVAIRDVKERIGHCPVCFHLSDGGICAICRAPDRDRATVLVVEQPKDVIAFERLGTYRGLYHVLQGRVAPIDGMGPEDLTIEALRRRVAAGGVREVILGTNPDLEGDGTALHVRRALAPLGVTVTRIARGIPRGSAIEFASNVILGDALEGRQALADAERD
ncbi:MAG: recombination protein RecR [Planctomycetes bacterium]|nr:recombination protein RecR [Planctomycetota bacterium]